MLSVLKQFGFKPRTVVWELTLACNLHCRHCGSRAGKARDDEMSTERALRLCDELADLGTRRVTLGGGEPTMHKDWPLIAAKLIARGVSVNMTTNGLRWTEQLARQVKVIGLESVCFSVDGLEETHEHVRRVKGHYQAILEAFRMCKRMKIPFSVITTIFKRNLDELEPMQKLFAELGVRSWQLQLGNPTGFLDENRDLVIEPEDVLTIVPLVAKLRRESKRPRVYVGDNIGYYGGLEEELREQKATVPFWMGCRAGCQVLGIESNGNIKGCLSLPSSMNNVDRFVEGNVKDTPLAEVWNRPGAFAYNREFTRDKLAGFCHDCEYAEICRGGCSWTTFAHTGDRLDNPFCYHRQLELKRRRDAESTGGEAPVEPT